MFSPQSKWLQNKLFYDIRFERSDSSISLIAQVSEQYKQKQDKTWSPRLQECYFHGLCESVQVGHSSKSVIFFVLINVFTN